MLLLGGVHGVCSGGQRQHAGCEAVGRLRCRASQGLGMTYNMREEHFCLP